MKTIEQAKELVAWLLAEGELRAGGGWNSFTRLKNGKIHFRHSGQYSQFDNECDYTLEEFTAEVQRGNFVPTWKAREVAGMEPLS